MSGEARANAVAQGFAIHSLAFESGFGGFDDGAHLLDGGGGGFGDRFGDGAVHLGFAGAGGKVRFDDGELPSFLVSEVLAIALSELVDGFFALLDESLQELDGFWFVDGADFFGFLVLDGGLDAAEDAEAEFVFGAHGVGEIFLDFLRESHLFLVGLNIAEEEELTTEEGTETKPLEVATNRSVFDLELRGRYR